MNDTKRAKAPRVEPHEIAPEELWTPQQAKVFLAHASEHDPDMGVLVRLALDSGARLGELLRLTWRDIQERRDENGVYWTVTFRRSVSLKRMPDDEQTNRIDTPKSDKSRSVDIDGTTYAALVAMKERYGNEPGGFVGASVPSAHGSRVSSTGGSTRQRRRSSGSRRTPNCRAYRSITFATAARRGFLATAWTW